MGPVEGRGRGRGEAHQQGEREDPPGLERTHAAMIARVFVPFTRVEPFHVAASMRRDVASAPLRGAARSGAIPFN